MFWHRQADWLTSWPHRTSLVVHKRGCIVSYAECTGFALRTGVFAEVREPSIMYERQSDRSLDELVPYPHMIPGDMGAGAATTSSWTMMILTILFSLSTHRETMGAFNSSVTPHGKTRNEKLGAPGTPGSERPGG